MIAQKTWREVRLMTFAYVLLLEVILVPTILLWPEIRQEIGALERIMPMQVLKNMIRAIADPDASAAYTAYMSVRLFFEGANIVGIAAAVLLGTPLIARERENGTLDLLLSRPVTRTRILLTKFGVIAAAIVIPLFLVSWSAIGWSRLVDENIAFWPVTLATMHAAAFVLMFAALTCLCSVYANTQAHAAFAIGAVVVSQVALFFTQSIGKASVFQLSSFDVYQPVMSGNQSFTRLFFGSTVWLLLAAVVLLGIAVARFRRSEP